MAPLDRSFPCLHHNQEGHTICMWILHTGRGGCLPLCYNTNYVLWVDGAPQVNLPPGPLHSMDTGPAVSGRSGMSGLPPSSCACKLSSPDSRLQARGNKSYQLSFLRFYKDPTSYCSYMLTITFRDTPSSVTVSTVFSPLVRKVESSPCEIPFGPLVPVSNTQWLSLSITTLLLQ